MSGTLHGRLQFARRYLTGLYDEAREAYESNPSRPGSATAQTAVSDAIDAVDRAIRATVPEEEQVNAS